MTDKCRCTTAYENHGMYNQREVVVVYLRCVQLTGLQGAYEAGYVVYPEVLKAYDHKVFLEARKHDYWWERR